MHALHTSRWKRSPLPGIVALLIRADAKYGKTTPVAKYRIITPEQVAFHYTIAGLVGRCLAWLCDQFLIWTVYILIFMTFGRLDNGVGMALIILSMFVVDFAYFTFFELYWAGQSPGKRIFRLRVMSARGHKLRFHDVLIRNLLRPVDMLPIAMVVGGITATIDTWHRRLGDLAADTIVVRDVRPVLPAALANEKNRVNSFQSDPALRGRILTRVSRPERDLIMDLAMRRDQIEPAVREDLFGRAAQHFRSRLSLPADLMHLSDEQTVVNLALLIQESKFTG